MKEFSLKKELTKSPEKKMKVYFDDENYPLIQEEEELQGKVPNSFISSNPVSCSTKEQTIQVPFSFKLFLARKTQTKLVETS